MDIYKRFNFDSFKSKKIASTVNIYNITIIKLKYDCTNTELERFDRRIVILS